MDVEAGIIMLHATAGRLGDALPLLFEPVEPDRIAAVEREVVLSPDLRRAFALGAPSGELPPFVQVTTLWEFGDLAAGQVGYAVDSAGDRLPAWERAWTAIGDESADPLVAHTDQPGTPVSIALHGQATRNLSSILRRGFSCSCERRC